MGDKWGAKRDFDLEIMQDNDWLIGLDEVGWGSFAGPIMVGACAIHKDFYSKLEKTIEVYPQFAEIDDSKKLSEKKRTLCACIISQIADNPGIRFSYGTAAVHEINEAGMVRAYEFAVRRALIMHHYPDERSIILLDGNREVKGLDAVLRPKADGLSYAVGCASIYAKYWRDRMMVDLSTSYPVYGWAKNKGYHCAEHRKGIIEHGPSPHQRTQFLKTSKLL